ncbi:MAG: PA14 domain-containing protein [Bacteroidota bacterium]
MYQPQLSKASFFQKSGKVKRPLLIILGAMLLVGATIPLGILQSGIDTPTPIGIFLDGKLPSTTPSTVSSWTSEIAFPNQEFTDPVDLREVPGYHKFLMAGKQGHLWTFDKDFNSATKDTMLNIADSVFTAGDAGLLGAIFHPKFNLTGNPAQDSNYVYVYYRFKYDPTHSGREAHCRLSRFTVDPVTLKATDASEFVMIQQYDRHDWHNGGGMFFDEDGFLWLVVGDEGGANDQYNSGQKIDVGLLAGILKIDVDNDLTRSDPITKQPKNPANPPAGWPGSFSQGYSIPKDNPWANAGGDTLGEFWGLGTRSPHRMTYDLVDKTIWIGDIGQGTREEVTRIFKDSDKGANLQWPYMEGAVAGQKTKPVNLLGTEIPPIVDYPRGDGNCVIGGFVYRGTKWPSLQGKYLFGDHGQRKIWYLDASTGEKTYMTTVPASGVGGKSGISSFATDSTGEIYVLKLFGTNQNGGKIFRLKPAVVAGEPPALLSQLDIFSDLNNLTPRNYMIPYSLIEPFWSDDALKSRWMVIPNDGTHNTAAEQIQYSANGDWEFPQGAVMVKHFDMEMDETNPNVTRKLETRLMVRGNDDIFYGLTYRWKDDQSDAELLTVGKFDTLQISTASRGPREVHWYYPDRQECLFCHNNGAKSVLGPKTRQLNDEIAFHQTGRMANQLKTLSHLEIFDTAPDTTDLGALYTSSSKDDMTASLDERARSYLDANCGYCHRPNNSITAFFDARSSTPLASQNILYGQLFNKFGLHDPRVVIPKDLEHSLVYQRMNAVHENLAMPPLAKNLKDTAGIELIREWILNMDEEAVSTGAGLVANYRSDFGAPGNGWLYLWNGTGPIGNDANYQALQWNGTVYDGDGVNNGFPDPGSAWANLSGIGGHAGQGTTQGQVDPRYVIAGFTITNTGTYTIENSYVNDANAGCGNGADVKVFVNNSEVFSQVIANGGSVNFDMNLGSLSVGDIVYVAVGPNGTEDFCDGFEMDFDLNASGLALATYETVADYADDFAGPISPGWEYLWNSTGPIGNDANYAGLVWNGVMYDGDGVQNGFPDALTYWAHLDAIGGHPGRALNQGQTDSRFVIAAFSVPTGGTYHIRNSTCTDENLNCGDGGEIRIYVNNTLKSTVSYLNGDNPTFDADLGDLNAGDKIYVCHGPKDTGDGCDGFLWDFTIQRSAIKYGQRIEFNPLANLSSSPSAQNITLGAVASSGLAVSYSVVKGPASVAGSTLTIDPNGTGEVIVRAMQAGNTNFFDAPEVERRFWVSPPTSGLGTGLLGTYFNDKDQSEINSYRVDPTIEFRWGSDAPLSDMELNTFSVVWEGEIEAPVSEAVTFFATSDDGVRVYVNNQLVVDNYVDQEASTATGSINMNAWERVPIRIEYYENRVYARAILEWGSNNMDRAIVPQIYLYPAAQSSFPIELLSFEAYPEGKDVYLNWTAELEENASHYLVEHSADGKQFQSLEEIPVKGEATGDWNYVYPDRDPIRGTNYYRLKMIDLDGSFVYSEIRQVDMNGNFLSVYPNPVPQGEMLQVKLDFEEARQVNVSIFDLAGREVINRQVEMSGSQMIEQISTRDWKRGTYIMVVKAAGVDRLIRKISIQ